MWDCADAHGAVPGGQPTGRLRAGALGVHQLRGELPHQGLSCHLLFQAIQSLTMLSFRLLGRGCGLQSSATMSEKSVVYKSFQTWWHLSLQFLSCLSCCHSCHYACLFACALSLSQRGVRRRSRSRSTSTASASSFVHFATGSFFNFNGTAGALPPCSCSRGEKFVPAAVMKLEKIENGP